MRFYLLQLNWLFYRIVPLHENLAIVIHGCLTLLAPSWVTFTSCLSVFQCLFSFLGITFGLAAGDKISNRLDILHLGVDIV
jgi:hypothetical protein